MQKSEGFLYATRREEYPISPPLASRKRTPREGYVRRCATTAPLLDMIYLTFLSYHRFNIAFSNLSPPIATPRLIWRYASSIHIPWGHTTYSCAPPPPAPNRGRSVSPDIESLRGPPPPHTRTTGSNDDRPEVKKMAHGAHWTYDYWFYDGEQEHSEDGEDADEDEVTAEDLCGL